MYMYKLLTGDRVLVMKGSVIEHCGTHMAMAA